MTAADQLRQDLELTIVKLDEGDWGPIERVKDAARLWLRILEGDEQTVEKVARVLQFVPGGSRDANSPVEFFFDDARAVLAVLAEGEKQ